MTSLNPLKSKLAEIRSFFSKHGTFPPPCGIELNLLDSLELAIEALEFYSNRSHWTTHDNELLFNNVSDEDWEKTDGFFAGGGTSRKTLTAIAEKLGVSS